MAQVPTQIKRWQGISEYPKEGLPDTSYFISALDYRTDPNQLTLLPGAVKESGTVVTDLVKWMDMMPNDLSVYSYGDTGNLYKRTLAGSWSLITQVPSSHGNGLQYFYGDDYLYATGDSTISRYGPISGTPQFTADYLKAAGGVPLNTNSLLLASASSMYAHAADSASLSITGDLTLETYFKMNSLPTVGNSMTLVGKWDESGALRSYKLDIYGVSGYFGTGGDGALTISSNTTEAPIDSACTGTAGATTLSATNASFAAGQVIFIQQSQGTNAGQWERTTIQGYTAGTITVGVPLKNTYTSGAQVRVLKQYSSVTVSSGITYTCKAWNGTVGGLIGWLCTGTSTITGTVLADGKGFVGGSQFECTTDTQTAYCGEGTVGASVQKNSSDTSANGNGGGAGMRGATGYTVGGGGGGSNGGYGTDGTGTPPRQGLKGNLSGSNDLTTMTFGGGGGGGVYLNTGGTGTGGNGGNGGGAVFITATTLTVTGSITSNGANGQNATGTAANSGGGAGAGGSILLKAQTATIGSSLITANGGTGGTGNNANPGGNGGNGRVHLDYYTSYTGTTSPTLDATQDNTLVTNTTYQSRLGISNDGTAYEYLTANIMSLTTGVWNRISVSWTASSSTAQFYMNGVSYGTSVGTKTAISDNTSLLYVGANKGASTIGNYFDGYLNDMRIWGNVQTSDQINTNLQLQLQGTEGGLEAYYTFCNVYTDKTANANTLTAVNTPTFPTDVPFSAATTRLDIDQSATSTGQTYTLGTSISETSANKLTFTPGANGDPQKSIAFKVNAKGTGSWTVTIHDAFNNVVATQTITNANLPSSGLVEFIFSTPWRIVINKTYHAHLTSSTGDGSVVTGTLNDLSTAYFYTYIGFLVTDTQFHPVVRFLNKIVIGNERYLATWDGASYNANFIAFPQGTHVRCFGFWREYLAIGTWQEATSGTPNIYDWPVGRVYFWDGISLTFNFYVDIAEGQVNAIQGMNTTLYIMSGWNSNLLAWEGGYIYASGNTNTQKIRKMPFLAAGEYLEMYPQAMGMWRGLLHLGLASNSNSTNLVRGVYSWGTLNKNYPESLSYDYAISTGNSGSTVTIGSLFGAGQDLLIGWKDGSGYGVDKVNFSNNPASVGTVKTLIQDAGRLYNDKSLMRLKAQFLPLASGESVGIGYSIDRGTWVNSTPDSTVGDTEARFEVGIGRGREYQYSVSLYSTGSTSPTLIGHASLVNPLETEQQF